MKPQSSGKGKARRIFRHPIVITLVGALIGAVAGWSVFSFSSMTGKARLLVGGSLTGVITSLAMVVYLRRSERFVLSEVTLSLPEFAEIKFAVNTEYKRVAWRLFIDTLTRVTTQPLGKEDGSLREALTSLHGVFTSTRDLLTNMEPSKPASAPTVEMLAVRMLNHDIRPFLAKRHVQLRAFETANPGAPEASWSENSECRADLERLRDRLIDYTVAFGELAGVKDVHAFFDPNAMLKKHAGPR
jgi:hypothetical protein